MHGLDFVGASVVRLSHDFRWPGGRKIAVVFNVAFEGWSDGKTPGIGPMGNPLPAGTLDTNALSWGNYGLLRGMERLLRVLDRVRLKASVMTSGVFAERAPHLVKATADAGHEIVAHSFAQDIIPAKLTAEEARADIARTTDALASVTGVRPRGWISPRGTPSVESARLLLDAGYAWHGDVFDDDLPYVYKLTGGGRIVGIPLTMEINDLPHAMRFGRSPRQFVELYDDVLAAALAADEARLIDVTAHAHCYGRPAGAAAYETIATKTKMRDDVFVATRLEIADVVAKAIV
ncbi:MAG TPA: polysaccharide deacetylase family protein [Pseudolabrys sp.]|nr:polysaccharide deacetylase family protein [Pseudolabrys sp.]